MSAAPAVIAAPEPEIDAINAIQPTAKQKAQWQDTMSLMSWVCPGFQHLFYKLLINNKDGYDAVVTNDIPVAATDAKNIMINPVEFFKYTLPQRVFIMGHEVVHNIYGDVEFLNQCKNRGTVPMDDGTTLPFRMGTMQKAMDFRINALLKESGIGEAPPDAHLDPTIAVANDGICGVYKKVYEDEETGGKKTGKNRGFDIVLKPGISGGNVDPTPRNVEQWAVEVAVAAATERMRKSGSGSPALDRFFQSILEPAVVWTDHIRGIFNRKVGSGNYNWRKPDRRMIVRDIFFPARSGNGAGWCVCWGDTSGSISEPEMCRYMAELASIIDDCKPQRLTVVWCDDKIHRIDEIEEALDLENIKHAGVKGGGGTSVKPVFNWIADHTETPEVFIGFTDGHVSFPKEAPPIPVIIWAMTTEQPAPWGDVVRINPKQ